MATEALDHVYQRNKIFIRAHQYILAYHACHAIDSSQFNPAVLLTCSSGNRRPCKEDEDSCALMCLGLRLQACNECQKIEQLLIVVV